MMSLESLQSILEDEPGEEEPMLKKLESVDLPESLTCLYFATSLDGADEQLLPAAFRHLERDLGFSPTVLGTLTIAQSFAVGFFSPMWGILADHYSQRKIMVTGCVCWGLATIGLAYASEMWTIIVLRAVNGLFLGSVSPVAQSIISAEVPVSSRSYAFGIVQFASSVGRILGNFATTAFGGGSLLLFGLQIHGWRVAFFVVGVLSIILGIYIGCRMPDVKPHDEQQVITGDSGSSPVRRPRLPWRRFFWEVLHHSILVPSTSLVLLEAIIGLIPWGAFTFLTMFFQYLGVPDVEAAMMSVCLLIGCMLAGPLGGFIGDYLHRRYPDHGRALAGQAALLVRIPLVAVLFWEAESKPAWLLAFLSFLVGLASFAAITVTRPVLSEVAMPAHRATVFSFVSGLEMLSASFFGAPIVGWMAENWFDYEPTNLVSISDLEKRRMLVRCLHRSERTMLKH